MEAQRGVENRARLSRLLASRYQAELAAGWLIILMAAGAALLPLLERTSGVLLIGGLLLASGVAELIAGMLRREARTASVLAGGVTIVAGILFLLRPATSFLPTLYVLTVWLLLRSIAAGFAALQAHGSARRWSLISAVTDLLLGLLLLAGLSATSLVVILFGPTQTVIASFAWFLALSFVTTGMYLLEVGNCEREAAGG